MLLMEAALWLKVSDHPVQSTATASSNDLTIVSGHNLYFLSVSKLFSKFIDMEQKQQYYENSILIAHLV